MSEGRLDEQLRQKYCPPLDEALFFALASDFDLDNTEQRSELEQILDDLREQAVPEQELELAPVVRNGLSHAEGSNIQSTSRTTSSHGKTITTEADDNLASITTGLSDLTTSDNYESETNIHDLDAFPEGLEHASMSDKEQWLSVLFPTIESIQITETVAKCHGDIQQSIDELLNLSFINEDVDRSYVPPPLLKGIDGFEAESRAKKVKTKKTRRKKERDDIYLSDDNISSGATTPNTNVWNKSTQDVEFIVSRSNMSTATVKSIYHQNNLNLALTIKSLVTKEAEIHASIIRTNDILQYQVAEMRVDFGDLPIKYIYGALLLGQMHPSAAKDLLDAMMAQPDDNMKSGKLIGVASYAPINLSDDESAKKMPIVRAPTMPGDPSLLMSNAGVHSIQASRAFSQASSAFRRGKSDHLMGGAAAYYASVGHDARKRQKELLASAADAYVGQQSTSNSLDLHGVTVEHAVRIARNAVQNWWEGLGDRKYVVGGVGSGFKIIVGLGTHSLQGIGRIGPAVSKMLMREGWKVNIQRGEVIVDGRARR